MRRVLRVRIAGLGCPSGYPLSLFVRGGIGIQHFHVGLERVPAAREIPPPLLRPRWHLAIGLLACPLDRPGQPVAASAGTRQPTHLGIARQRSPAYHALWHVVRPFHVPAPQFQVAVRAKRRGVGRPVFREARGTFMVDKLTSRHARDSTPHRRPCGPGTTHPPAFFSRHAILYWQLVNASESSSRRRAVSH